MNLAVFSSVGSMIGLLAALEQRNDATRRGFVIRFLPGFNRDPCLTDEMIRRLVSPLRLVTISNRRWGKLLSVLLSVLLRSVFSRNLVLFEPRPFWLGDTSRYKVKSVVFYGDGLGCLCVAERPFWLLPEKPGFFAPFAEYVYAFNPYSLTELCGAQNLIQLETERYSKIIRSVAANYWPMLRRELSFSLESRNIVVICLSTFVKTKRMTAANEELIVRGLLAKINRDIAGSISIIVKPHPMGLSTHQEMFLIDLANSFPLVDIEITRKLEQVPTEVLFSFLIESKVNVTTYVASIGPILAAKLSGVEKCLLFPTRNEIDSLIDKAFVEVTHAQRDLFEKILDVNCYS
jgi:hypothetical protein